jgi:DNA-directed RNA polymerase subunit RPC12/RpoP
MSEDEKDRKPGAGKYRKAIKTNARKLDDAYKALGARAYRLYRDGKISHDDLAEVAGEIDILMRQVEQDREELEKIMAEKKGSKCPYCEAKSAPGSKFCPGCGRELPLPGDLKETEKVPCPNCAQPIPRGAKYCMHCGKKA